MLFRSGRVAAGWVAAYPPGIPLWTPGERITGAMVEWALAFRAAGGWLRGLEGDLVRVVADEEGAGNGKGPFCSSGKEEIGKELSNL